MTKKLIKVASEYLYSQEIEGNLLSAIGALTRAAERYPECSANLILDSDNDILITFHRSETDEEEIVREHQEQIKALERRETAKTQEEIKEAEEKAEYLRLKAKFES